jgi:hypothetical protein
MVPVDLTTRRSRMVVVVVEVPAKEEEPINKQGCCYWDDYDIINYC